MKRRTLPYGYEMVNGELTVLAEGSEIVQRIFESYLQGASYQKISKQLNHQGIAYREDAPLWDKHKVKRVLENPKYTGSDGYPQIIDEAAYHHVREIIASKHSDVPVKKNEPEQVLWKRLACGECGDRLMRQGGRRGQGDTRNLLCHNCGMSVRLSESKLYAEVLTQTDHYVKPLVEKYMPTEEVTRVENAICQGIEDQATVSVTVRQILCGVAARYQCCVLEDIEDYPASTGWARFSQIAVSVQISADGTITVQF